MGRMLKPGDRVEYVGERFWHGPGADDWLEPGDQGVLIDLEPPDDAPIVSFDKIGGLVVRQADVRPVERQRPDPG